MNSPNKKDYNTRIPNHLTINPFFQVKRYKEKQNNFQNYVSICTIVSYDLPFSAYCITRRDRNLATTIIVDSSNKSFSEKSSDFT